MSLNIKSAETDQLVQELATLTGETQTMAVTIAVRERDARSPLLSRAASIKAAPAAKKAPTRTDAQLPDRCLTRV